MRNCIGGTFASNKKLLSSSSHMEEVELLIHKSSIGIPERVKIVVNKKQLQRLMLGVEEVQLRRMLLESLLRRSKKWRPSLVTIPEL